MLMSALTYFIVSYPLNKLASVKILLDKPIWTFDTGEQTISPPLVYDSKMFVQTASSLSSVDLETQRLLWKSDIPTDNLHIIPITASDGILIAQGENGGVIALIAKTGQLLWKDRLDVYHGTEAALFDIWIEDVEIYDETVYVARYSTYLTAYNLYSGEIRWSTHIPDKSILVSIIDSENVFLTTSTSLMQFDGETGRIVKQYSLNSPGAPIQDVLKDEDTFYFARTSDKGISVFALDSNTFGKKWTVSSDVLSLSKFAGMVIDNNVLYISGDRLIAISTRNGQLLWNGEIKSRYGPPVVSDEKVYIQDRTNIYAYDKLSGLLIGRLPIKSDIPWTFLPNVKPTMGNNLLIVPSRTGHIYGYILED
jgi:outer membrane protein assembly factor BamB